MEKKIKCNLCGGTKYEEIAKKDKNTKIVKCKNCDLVFVESIPSNSFLNKLYQKEYFNPQTRPCPEISNYLRQKSIFEGRFAKEIERIKKFKSKGRLLDIGCGPGFFLNIAKNLGFKVYGLDISQFAAKYAKEKFKLNVFCGELSKAKFLPNFFDVITIYQTVEHVKNPLKFLREVNRILKKDGVIILTTPNQGNILAKILGKKWFGYYYVAHLYFFTPKTIKKILSKSGFSKINLTFSTPYYLSLAEALERLYHFYPSFLTNAGIKLINPLGNLAHLRFISPAITGKSMRIEGFKDKN